MTTARDDNPALHHIVVERDEEGPTSVRFICDGGDEAPCHHWPDCGCEAWGEEHGDPVKGVPPEPGHEDTQQQHCWMEPWFNHTSDPFDWTEMHVTGACGIDGMTTEQLRSGPISAIFDYDHVMWGYAS